MKKLIVMLLMLVSVNCFAFTKDQIYPWAAGVWYAGDVQLIVKPDVKTDKFIICLKGKKLEGDVVSVDWINRKITLGMDGASGQVLWTIGYEYDQKTYLQLVAPSMGEVYFSFVRNITPADQKFIDSLEWW